MELDCPICMIKIHSNLNSQGNGKFEAFCQDAYDLQNLGHETLFIEDYEYVRKSTCIWLVGCKDMTQSLPFRMNEFE